MTPIVYRLCGARRGRRLPVRVTATAVGAGPAGAEADRARVVRVHVERPAAGHQRRVPVGQERAGQDAVEPVRGAAGRDVGVVDRLQHVAARVVAGRLGRDRGRRADERRFAGVDGRAARRVGSAPARSRRDRSRLATTARPVPAALTIGRFRSARLIRTSGPRVSLPPGALHGTRQRQWDRPTVLGAGVCGWSGRSTPGVFGRRGAVHDVSATGGKPLSATTVGPAYDECQSLMAWRIQTPRAAASEILGAPTAETTPERDRP